MAKLTLNDASVLALLAQHPNAPTSRRRALLVLLSAEGKRVAAALKGDVAKPKHGADASATAKDLMSWAGKNMRLVASSGKPLERTGASPQYKRIILTDVSGPIILGQSAGSVKKKTVAFLKTRKKH